MMTVIAAHGQLLRDHCKCAPERSCTWVELESGSPVLGEIISNTCGILQSKAIFQASAITALAELGLRKNR